MKSLFIALMFVFCSVLTSSATVISFDDQDDTGDWINYPYYNMPVANNYAGLTFSNNWMWYFHGGWSNLPENGTNEIFAYPMGTYAEISFDQDVTFNGLWQYGQMIRTAGEPQNQRWYEGYHNGIKLYESKHFDFSDNLDGQFITLNWIGIDQIVLKHTDFTWFGDGFSVLVDDITFNEVPVPEPSTILLLGAGLGWFAIWRRNKRS